MGAIQSGIGLVSGIDTSGLINALISIQRQQVARLESRIKGFQNTQAGVATLEANVLAIKTSVQALGLDSTFNSFTVKNTEATQLTATATAKADPGTYEFQVLRKAGTHSIQSRGYANANQQTLGSAGTLTIQTGGELSQPTLLDMLNGGQGIRRGTIRITDRSGNSAEINLANVYTAADVIDAINSATGISVVAGSEGGRFTLTDTSGGAANNLIVTDLNGGFAAADLGIAKSVAGNTLTGDEVYQVTGDFTLDRINDGNTVRLFAGAPDIRITLTDDTQLDVTLDGGVTLSDVINKINSHADNNGKVTAALSDGRLVLTDTSGGGGASAFGIEDLNSSSVVKVLGLDVSAAGISITGRKLVAGLNSVKLSNLRGGYGITQLGQISLTDRTGTTAVIDLSSAESLDEVINAINAAADGGGTKLKLTASVNDTGTGIVLADTSGTTASNLIVADVGGSTLAAELGIAVNAAQASVNSGSLKLRYVNEATSVANYAPDGGGIAVGGIQITDSAGNLAVVEMSSAVKNIGDVIQRINAASGISVHAELNETGDGFVIVDGAGGSGELDVQETGSTTAADLRLLGDAVLGSDGKYRISSRSAAVVDVAAGDTLDQLVAKINAAAGFVKADVVNDGSTFNPVHLRLRSNTPGDQGKLVFDDGGLGLNLATVAQGQDALLRVGSVATGTIIASSSNSFNGAATGIDVTALKASDAPAEIAVTRDSGKVESAIEVFVKNYNTFADSLSQLTLFDLENNKRGVLQGSNIALRSRSRLESLINRQLFGSDHAIRSLSDLGINFGANGKLVFNKAVFNVAYNKDPEEVNNFFLEADKGFSDIAEKAVDSLIDPISGSFTLERNALNDSIEALDARIEQLDAILAIRKDRLLREFTVMEQLLAQMQAQQTALSQIFFAGSQNN